MKPTARKWWTLVPHNTRTSLLKGPKQVRSSSFLCISMGGIEKSFKAKSGIFALNLNSKRVLQNQQYFMVLKSYFGAFFKTRFFYVV